MRIVIAPDSFRGSLDAAGAADAVKAGDDAARSARAVSASWIRRHPGARRSGAANGAPAAREEV